MAGLSLQEVADRLDNSITKQALHKYEQGKSVPDSEGLLRLATVLDVRPDYFTRTNALELQGVEFRKRTKLTKTEEASILARATDFFERYIELETLTDHRDKFNNPLQGMAVSTKVDVETAAEQLRQAWHLGTDPIPNVVEMLEDHGLKVYQLNAPETFDGLAACIADDSGKENPVIVINTCFDVVRQRFTAIHELAHRSLCFSSAIGPRDLENLCHCFAGAFLIPRERFISAMSPSRKRISVRELQEMKAYYGVSMQAIMRRARDLDVIDDAMYTGFSIYFNKQGWRKNEPGTYKGEERAMRFQRLLHRAAAEGTISLNKAASLNGQTQADFRKTFMII
jgi:Zn-dependent peptidase ImmA (M78 family)/transcriptional regulator with XRE-family HTH domain